jgi:N-acetylglucosamine-6-phosphate deacetylase
MVNLIYNATVITPDGIIENGWLTWVDERIDGIGNHIEIPEAVSGLTIDAAGAYLMPGFIDLHVHGALGHDVMDADVQGLLEMAAFFARHGVTSFVPTTLSSTTAETLNALHTIMAAMSSPNPGARIIGAHIEGPYLNPEKAGAQDTTQIRRAERDEVLLWLDTGIVKLIAIAPEYVENLWLIEECVRRGIVVAAAHTNASYAQIAHASALGLSHLTHTFNGMRGLHHREPGVVGAAFALKSLVCELIADNVHVHPVVMNILWELKGKDRIVLITDATRGTGMPDGTYILGGQTFHVQQQEARLADGTLAGSTATMDSVVANFAEGVGSLAEIWTTTSYNAARQLCIDDWTGSLEPGKVADLVLIDAGYRVSLTVCGGQLCYRT